MNHPEANESFDDQPAPVKLANHHISRAYPLDLGESDVFSSIKVSRLPMWQSVENYCAIGSVRMDFRDGLCPGESVEAADAYLTGHQLDIRTFLRDRYSTELHGVVGGDDDGDLSWERTTARFETQLPMDASTDQVAGALESNSRAVALHSDVDLSYTLYDSLRVHLDALDQRREAAAAMRSQVPVFATTEVGAHSQTVELRTAEGLLQDAPDGTPAYRHQDLRGNTIMAARFTADINCDSPLGEPSWREMRTNGTVRVAVHSNASGHISDLADGTPGRREFGGDGQHVRLEMRYDHGVPADAADGTPHRRDFNLDGSVATTTTAAGKWTQDGRGNTVSHVDPRNGQTVRTAGLNGGQLTIRVDAGDQLHNGPGGSPASTACRSDGTIETASWYEHGVPIRTVNYAPDGYVESEYAGAPAKLSRTYAG